MTTVKAKIIESFLLRLFYGPFSPRYQPVGNSEVKGESHSIISFQKLALVTLSLPLCGFVFCIIWSLLFNFVDSTSTHCGVSNYLPSVSASIGAFAPQKYVWRLTIALHSAPRYLVAYIYYKLFHSSTFLLSLNYAEISSLLGLTIVSSTENFVIHANCFLIFITSSFTGTVVHLLQEDLWSTLKLKLFIINSISWILALFFYVRHNEYCETGVYTLFAAAEYVFVLSNMIFHFQAYFDFSHIHFATSHKYAITSFSSSKLTV